jgi:hypothetical protein
MGLIYYLTTTQFTIKLFIIHLPPRVMLIPSSIYTQTVLKNEEVYHCMFIDSAAPIAARR